MVHDDRIKAPTGKWKDGLFDCFALGVCHPHLCCAFFCSKIAMAQIMTRMSLTWLGEPGQRVATRNTFKVVLILVVSYLIYCASLVVGTISYSAEELPIFIIVLKTVGGFLFGLWSLYRYVSSAGCWIFYISCLTAWLPSLPC